VPRVVTGLFKGLRLASPAGLNTRPTADRVKEAVFSMLVSLPFSFEGARVLDFFAGGGGLALEALSRGAASAVLADQGREALAAIAKNLAAARRRGAPDISVPGNISRHAARLSDRAGPVNSAVAGAVAVGFVAITANLRVGRCQHAAVAAIGKPIDAERVTARTTAAAAGDSDWRTCGRR